MSDETLQAQAHAQEPGKPPSNLWVSRSDPNSVAKYNEKVERYNNQLDLYRRLMDKVGRAKERYEDALEKYNEKKADLEEQVNRKYEDLEPALEQDIIVFLDKMQNLVSTHIHDQVNVFTGFMFIYITKKAYSFLDDKVNSATGKRSASDIIRKLDEELGHISLDQTEKIKEGLIETASYFYTCFRENESIFQNIEKDLSILPYNDCRKNEEKASSLTSLPVETEFKYKDVVDPDELAQIELQVRERKSGFEKNIKCIEEYSDNMIPTFEKIAQVSSSCNNNLAKMEGNKKNKLDKLFLDIPFTLSVLEESEQDEHLKKHKKWLGEIEQKINKKFTIEVNTFKERVVDTDMLIKPTKELLLADEGLRFLLYRDKLAAKRQQFIDSIHILDEHIDGINRLPQENSEELRKKMSSWLNISLLPLGNLGVLSSIKNSIKKFIPALSSSNSFYVSLREILIKKFQVFLVVHILLIVLCGALSFVLEKQLRPIAYGLALIYGISSLGIFINRNQLKKCSSVSYENKSE